MDTYEEKESGLIPIKELDLFYTPPMEGAIQKKQWVQYRPTATISDGSPLEFIMSGTGSQYIDLKRTYLSVITRIIKDDGSKCPPEEKVGPVNLTLHSLFSQIDLFLNQKLASTVGVNYPYKAMIDTLLNATSEKMGSSLQTEGFVKDVTDFIDDDDPLEGTNTGLTKRFVMMSWSKLTEFRGPLHLDLVDQDRYIVNDVETKLSLWPTKDAFRLMAHGDDTPYKI